MRDSGKLWGEVREDARKGFDGAPYDIMVLGMPNGWNESEGKPST